jgi:hypothetical protein
MASCKYCGEDLRECTCPPGNRKVITNFKEAGKVGPKQELPIKQKELPSGMGDELVILHKDLKTQIEPYISDRNMPGIMKQLDMIRRYLFKILVEEKPQMQIRAAQTLLLSYQVAKNLGLKEIEDHSNERDQR